MEVVVGRVTTRVALGADCSAEDDEVLGDAWEGGGGLLRQLSSGLFILLLDRFPLIESIWLEDD